LNNHVTRQMKEAATKYRTHAIVLLLAAAIFAVYSNILNAPFVLDDRMYIVENGEIRGLSGLWPPAGTRYVAYLTFALNYSMGGLDPFGYHLVNIVIHIFNSILVYSLVALTFRTPLLKGTAAARPNLPFFAGALSAFIFAMHPVQTEAVTYVSQRFASLAALFYLLSLALFVKWRIGKSGSKGGYAFYALSLVSAMLAMKTKEISFTLPFVILLYDLAFFKVGPKERALALLPFILTLLIIPLAVLFPNAAASGIDEKIRRAQLDELLNFSRYEYLITQFRVVTTYIRLALLPTGQNLIYDYRVSRSFFEPAVIASFIFLLSIFVSAAYVFFRSRKSHSACGMLAGAGVLWFFIALSIESSIIPIRDVIFEHRLYLPLAGAAISISGIFLSVIDFSQRRMSFGSKAFASMALVIVAALGAAAYARNMLWKEPVKLYEDIAAKSPERASVHFDLGKLYRDSGRGDDAVREYKLAIALDPGYAAPHTNLGNLYLDNGLSELAMEEYRAALRIKPDDVNAHYNLGRAFSALSMNNEALNEFWQVLRLDPGHVEAHNHIGNIYLKAGKLDMAGREYMAALRLRPDYVLGHNNLGNVHYLAGRLDKAEGEYRKAIELDPRSGEARHNLGALLLAKGAYARAAEELKAAVDIKPDRADTRFLLGNAYLKMNLPEDAIREYRAAIRLNPFDVEAHLKIADALMETGKAEEALDHYNEFLGSSSSKGSTELGRVNKTVHRLRQRLRRSL